MAPRDEKVFGGPHDGMRVRDIKGMYFRMPDPISAAPMTLMVENEPIRYIEVKTTDYKRMRVWSLDGLVTEWWHPDLVKWSEGKEHRDEG